MSLAGQLRDVIAEFYLPGTPEGKALEEIAAKIDALETPTLAFDRATDQLLDAEPAENLAGQIAKLRVLFMDELAQPTGPTPP